MEVPSPRYYLAVIYLTIFLRCVPASYYDMPLGHFLRRSFQLYVWKGNQIESKRNQSSLVPIMIAAALFPSPSVIAMLPPVPLPPSLPGLILR